VRKTEANQTLAAVFGQLFEDGVAQQHWVVRRIERERLELRALAQRGGHIHIQHEPGLHVHRSQGSGVAVNEVSEALRIRQIRRAHADAD